jgi:hypothetical protein
MIKSLALRETNVKKSYGEKILSNKKNFSRRKKVFEHLDRDDERIASDEQELTHHKS